MRCRSDVTLLASGVQGSVSTLPHATAAALCAAAAATGDRVAGVVLKHTAVRARRSSLCAGFASLMHDARGGDGAEVSETRLALEEAVLEVVLRIILLAA